MLDDAAQANLRASLAHQNKNLAVGLRQQAENGVQQAELLAMKNLGNNILEKEKANLEDEVAEWEGAAIRMRKEIERYKNLLSKPMQALAGDDPAFETVKRLYEEQQEFLKNWIKSQQAFKGLARFYAEKAGVDVDEDREEYDNALKKAKAAVEEINPDGNPTGASGPAIVKKMTETK